MMPKMRDIDDIKQIVDRVDGWLTHKEGELLYNLAKNCCGKGVIVEIGSWKGKSTTWLAKGSKAGKKVKVYAIDPHTGSSEHKKMYGQVLTYAEFRTNMKNASVSDIVFPIVKTSAEAAKNFDRPVELIFIDGAHEYELVKLDFESWFPKIAEGGIMAFHDTTTWPGPKKIVEKFVYKSEYFKNIRLRDSITYATKVKQNTLKDKINNRIVLLSKIIYEMKLNLRNEAKTLLNKIKGALNANKKL